MSRRPLLSAAQIRPIDIGAQFFAGHGAIRFALDIDRETFAARFPIESDVSNVGKRCFTP